MKVFFDASLRGKRLYDNNYKVIRNVLVELGHELIAYPLDLSTPEKVAQETEEESETYYRKLMQWISDCEVAVFEVSYPSIGIGHEVSLSLDKGKQVIVLHVEGKRPYILESRADERLQVIEYKLDSLSEELEQGLGVAREQMESRFTLIVDGATRNALDKAVERGESRSEYIRRLIKEDVDKEVKR